MHKIANVSAGRSVNFLQATQAVSDYLDTLPLTNEQNNKLIELFCKNINMAEQDAFGLGIKVAAHASALAAREKRIPIEKDFKVALEEYGALGD